MAELMPIDPVVTTAPASALDPEAQGLNRLNGKGAPLYEIQVEQPWHRAAAELFATGVMSSKDVAHALDRGLPTVSNLLKQTWFQERVTEIMAERGCARDVMALFKAEVGASLVTLIEIRDDVTAKKSDRIASARDILDRALGKPKQFIENTDAPKSDDPVADVKRLEAELHRNSL